MLATVQSIAALTLCDVEVAAYASFEARLSALSRTHELLARCAWEGVALDELMMQVLAPYRTVAAGRLRLAGAKVVFGAHTALALGVAFHEIARRAADDGALSCAGGRVEVCWCVLRAVAGGARLRLTWREYGSALPNLFSHQGFGPRLVERSVTGQLRGTLAIEHTTDGLRYVIELPLTDNAAAPR
jgi:two-component sensor histidine kinase